MEENAEVLVRVIKGCWKMEVVLFEDGIEYMHLKAGEWPLPPNNLKAALVWQDGNKMRRALYRYYRRKG